MSLRDTMREYRKATLTIFGGIGLIIFGFIVGFVSIALGVLFIYTPSKSSSVSSSSGSDELFKWAVSAGTFGFVCILAGYSMIGGGCRLCFSSCSECCSNGCGRIDCEDLSCCDCGACSDYCWSAKELIKENCCCASCCSGKQDANAALEVSYNMDTYETSRQEHTIVHLGYENNHETKEEIPLEVLQMQQQLPMQAMHADVKIENPNVVESNDNNYMNNYGGFSGIVSDSAVAIGGSSIGGQQLEEQPIASAYQFGAVDQTTVEYHRSESNEAVMEISAPTQQL